jgi:hypothetical protein
MVFSGEDLIDKSPRSNFQLSNFFKKFFCFHGTKL